MHKEIFVADWRAKERTAALQSTRERLVTTIDLRENFRFQCSPKSVARMRECMVRNFVPMPANLFDQVRKLLRLFTDDKKCRACFVAIEKVENLFCVLLASGHHLS